MASGERHDGRFALSAKNESHPDSIIGILVMDKNDLSANSTQSRTPRQLAEAIADFLVVLFEKDQVFEIRALRVQEKYGGPHTKAGFFRADRENLVKAALAVVNLPAYKGVYYTLNPVKKELLARRCNRIDRAGDGELTKDTNIERRRWLLIDCDPIRDPHISATDAEKQHALQTAMAVRDYLRSIGWPEPIIVDSGNGYHLLYRIDLRADDDGFVERVLLALAARFDDDHVKIDRSVHNPARICKMVGTFACKGDSTTERPHRLAKPIDTPNSIGVVTHEQLETLAADVRTDPFMANSQSTAAPSLSPNGTGQQHNHKNGQFEHRLKVEEFLMARDFTYRKKDGNGPGTIWIIDKCPFDPTHGGHGEVCVGQLTNGATWFKCWHNSCAGKKWAHFRDAVGRPKADEYDPALTQKRRRRRNGAASPPAARKNGISGDAVADSTILVNTKEYEIIERVTARLAECDDELYQRGGQLVRVMRPTRAPSERDRVRHSGSLRIEPLPLPDLRARITRYCNLEAERGDSIIPISPPHWLTPGVAVQSAPWQGIRPLQIVTETPLLRPDGTILQTPGFDSNTGILYEPVVTFEPIPDELTKDDALRALDELLHVVCDFPFAARMHLSAWLASLLTPFARPAFAGPVPLFLTDANVRGCGKGLSASAAALIATGRPFATAIYAHDAAEMYKTVTAIALTGEPVVMLDNLVGPFGNGSLDAALTSTEWHGRILGKSEQPRVPLACIWYATGNNCVIAADTARRICHIRIESRDEKPEEREGFQHPDLLAWVRIERPRLLRAALTILAAYCRAGRPEVRLKPWGSFEGWSVLIRQCIVWLDMPDPGETRVALAEDADQDVQTLTALLSVWEAIVPQGQSATAAEVLAKIANGTSILRPEEHETLVTVCPDRNGGLPTAHRLGNMLRRFKGRVRDSRFFDSQAETRKGVAKWRVVKPDAGTAGTAGTASTPLHDDATIARVSARAEPARTVPAVPAVPASNAPTIVGDAWEPPPDFEHGESSCS